MMFRGTIHLLLYRLVYHELLIPAEEVQSPASLARLPGHATTCSTSASRASSTWPAGCSTCSASSSPRRTTTTCWRRASPTTGGGSTSTGKTSWSGSCSTRWSSGSSAGRSPRPWRRRRLAVFVPTWALHAYQSFWLRGTWGFSAPDALFWGILGVLVLVNVQLDARRPRGRSPKVGPRSLPGGSRSAASRRPARSRRSPCSGRSGRARASGRGWPCWRGMGTS